jgi:4-amino-4-deoxy-L-arabinose transferase-like glycosyltransferase
MLTVLIWAAILWACFGVGAAALRRLRALTGSSAEEIPFAVALGMGVLSYLVLGLGLAGLIKAWIFVLVICALALLGWRHVLRLGRDAVTSLPRIKSWHWSALPLLGFILAMAVFTLIGTLAPAGETDYDGLVYHLTIPKVYIRDGRVHPIPWLSHSNFPFSLEMLYMLGLALDDQSLAKLFHFGCGWLTICAVFAFARRAWGGRAGGLAAAVLAAVPLVAWEMMVAYNELALALYAFLAVFALSRWAEGRDSGGSNGWLWVSAILCGLALGTKMLAGAVLVFVLLATLFVCVRQRRPAALPLLGLIAISAAVAAPWYIKSYLWTGNPVYPFFYEVFGGKYWTADRARLYTAAQKEFGIGSGPLSFFALPWNLTMNSYRFFDMPNQLRAVNVVIWVFGPALLALLPTLLVTRRVRTPGLIALWFALFYTLVWFAMSQNGRYLIPILPGLCACGGLAAARLTGRRQLLSAGAASVLLLSSLWALYAAYSLASPSWRVALGLESKSEYLQKASPVYRMLDAVNRATPPNARIIVFGDEPRMFYLERDYLMGNHAEILTGADLASPDSLLAALRRLGVTHLLIGVSVLREMAAKRGAVETDLAGLEAEGKIRPLGMYDTLSLWQLAGEANPGPR